VLHSLASRRAETIYADFTMAIVEAEVACEVLLDAVLLVMAWEEGTEPSVAATWFDDGLATRVRKYYATRLGGVGTPI